MEYEDKVMALAKHLEIDPALIEEGYGDYLIVNGRTIKDGKTPEQYKQLAADFRKLLNEEDVELVTDHIINFKSDEQIKEAYDVVKSNLETLRIKSEHRKEQMKRLSFKPEEEAIEDVYNRLREDNFYVENVLFHLIMSKESYNDEYCRSLRRAWLGQPVSDTRKDRQIDDGEYRVLTDDEADDAEREYLDQLFDDIVEVPPQLQNYVDKDKWIDDNSGNRGESLSGYDSNEEEVEFEGTTYYIYRNN